MTLYDKLIRFQQLILCFVGAVHAGYRKFEDVSKLFDHAAHNGSNYLNGHCFVSLMLYVSVRNHKKVVFLAVPLGYWL